MPSASKAPPALATPAIDLLRRLTGNRRAKFREGQLEAIEQIVERRGRVLCVQRTGWGKSAVYFVATAMLREQGAGPTILVSPLIALMRNQLEAAEALGIHAASVNSSNREDWQETFEQIEDGEVDLLLLSPERLANPHFRRNVLPELIRTSGLLVIDEAHCISDWGHDFRPDYRRIAGLVKRLPETAAVLCTTATANDRVIADVTEQLGAGEHSETGDERDLITIRGTLDRPSLRLEVCDMPSQAERMAWLATYIPQLQGSGIVYCLTVRDTNNVTNWLDQNGIKAEAYSGKVESDDRIRIEGMLLRNEIKCVVATSALGMGYDKPDLGFVVHFQGPGSPIAYYQQVGRAGRGLKEADAVLLRGTEDRDVQDFFIKSAFPPAEQVARVMGLFDEADGAALGRRADERDQPRQGPHGADAQAARGRGRAQQGPGRLGAQPPRVDLRRGADHRRHRRETSRAEGHGALRQRRPLPHGVAPDRARRPRRRALRPMLDLHRAEVRRRARPQPLPPGHRPPQRLARRTSLVRHRNCTQRRAGRCHFRPRFTSWA